MNNTSGGLSLVGQLDRADGSPIRRPERGWIAFLGDFLSSDPCHQTAESLEDEDSRSDACKGQEDEAPFGHAVLNALFATLLEARPGGARRAQASEQDATDEQCRVRAARTLPSSPHCR